MVLFESTLFSYDRQIRFCIVDAGFLKLMILFGSTLFGYDI